MKLLIVLVCSTVAVSAKTLSWQEFKNTHNKEYKSQVEEVLRFGIFNENLKKIEEHNAKFEQGLTTFKKGVNKFADWTKEEFLGFLKLSKVHRENRLKEFHVPKGETPLTIDWRSVGAVTPIKDQGSCGSCWAFSTTGSLEGQLQIQKGKLVSLSEQNLVDCSSDYGNMGCNGGLMDYGFEYIQRSGINSEADYPYEGVDRRCRFNASAVVTKISSFVDIEADNEKDLENAVGTIGPVSVAIDATEEMQLYESGLFTDIFCSKLFLNHGVLAVGYGSENGKDYWLVKNSWGLAWGEKGYIRMLRGKNMCGIAADATYPKL